MEARGRPAERPSLIRVEPAAAAAPLVLVGGLLAWWAWKRGAYFPVSFLPGAMVLLLTLAALLAFAPWPGRLRGPAQAALAGLAALAAWTALSALWSPSPDTALEDALRVGAYAIAFAIGMWSCLMLGRRMLFALAPLAGASALVAVATLIALSFGSDLGELLEDDATLRYPLGYRNAAAAFFVMSVIPLVSLAARRELDWRIRGASAAAATLCAELAVLSQSRGAVFATVVGIAALIAFHPDRWRLTAWLGLSVGGAATALPWLLGVFGDSGGLATEALSPLRSACAAMAVSAAAVGLVGCAMATGPRSVEPSPATRRTAGRVLAAVGIVLVLAGAAALVTTEGGPTGWIDRQTQELSAGTPDLTSEGTRYGLDLRSERGDFWRVAIDDFTEHPLYGEGGGGFRFSYLLDRDSDQQPEDPHSVFFVVASELGLPGLVAFGFFLFGSALAVWRARRLGPSAAALAAAAYGMLAYWLVHAGVEWFWAYPSITLPVAWVLGAASAPGILRPPAHPLPPPRRRALALVPVAVALALVPFWLSERYTQAALDDPDVTEAYSKLGVAADLNPLSDRPLVAEAVIAEKAGEPQRALAALADAQERQPDEWTLYYLEARVLAGIDPASAERALERAEELNPRGEELEALRRDLEGR